MSWKNSLNTHSQCKFHFRDRSVSYGEMAASLTVTGDSPFLWQAEWTHDSVSRFLSALDSGVSVVVSSETSPPFPQVEGLERGWIFLPPEPWGPRAGLLTLTQR